jgi:hypothetical protein
MKFGPFQGSFELTDLEHNTSPGKRGLVRELSYYNPFPKQLAFILCNREAFCVEKKPEELDALRGKRFNVSRNTFQHHQQFRLKPPSSNKVHHL